MPSPISTSCGKVCSSEESNKISDGLEVCRCRRGVLVLLVGVPRDLYDSGCKVTGGVYFMNLIRTASSHGIKLRNPETGREITPCLVPRNDEPTQPE